jgi:predicted 3-demethylubiquinone-9 3-methyltransferase (glyoxalase superfamily)
VPKVLVEMIQDKDVKKSQKAMKAMLQMQKLDIETLRQAYEET